MSVWLIYVLHLFWAWVGDGQSLCSLAALCMATCVFFHGCCPSSGGQASAHCGFRSAGEGRKEISKASWVPLKWHRMSLVTFW